MSSQQPTVLVIGGSGRTGQSVIDGLLESGQYNIAALTRPSSASKPAVNALRVRGVEIRIGDCTADPPAKLAEHLQGIDVLLSAINTESTLEQKPIFKAAVVAGVKRIIPCDFETPGAKGVRDVHDMKLEVREYIQKLTAESGGRSAYTFIDIGWVYYTSDDKPVLLTDVHHIGPWAARIVGDPRTVSQYVIVWEDELTLRDSREIAEAASGEAQALRERRVTLDKHTLLKRMVEGKVQYAETKECAPLAAWWISEYIFSVHFLGENSLENAKKLGALDAKQLYPNIVQTPFKEYVKKFYVQGAA
ncbi:NAD-binding protein [Fomitopsis schrenkii]|uniref:NAD-binding protein n=1 Tax=Fomitopsis schrenkii TaxID=2126942 RepID=S8DX99_FOMSC|nr:NAD-binding protein [Fomitopsis schrenkii]